MYVVNGDILVELLWSVVMAVDQVKRTFLR